jgi:cytoskeletal protein CcmA (bactofilin family)
VAGNVRADNDPAATLSVSETGAIDGNVDVPTVVLNGSVRGDILARDRVVLGATAKVHGNVHYGVIEMTLGAEIKGKLVPLPTSAPATTEG